MWPFLPDLHKKGSREACKCCLWPGRNLTACFQIARGEACGHEGIALLVFVLKCCMPYSSARVRYKSLRLLTSTIGLICSMYKRAGVSADLLSSCALSSCLVFFSLATTARQLKYNMAEVLNRVHVGLVTFAYIQAASILLRMFEKKNCHCKNGNCTSKTPK